MSSSVQFDFKSAHRECILRYIKLTVSDTMDSIEITCICDSSSHFSGKHFNGEFSDGSKIDFFLVTI